MKSIPDECQNGSCSQSPRIESLERRVTNIEGDFGSIMRELGAVGERLDRHAALFEAQRANTLNDIRTVVRTELTAFINRVPVSEPPEWDDNEPTEIRRKLVAGHSKRHVWDGLKRQRVTWASVAFAFALVLREVAPVIRTFILQH